MRGIVGMLVAFTSVTVTVVGIGAGLVLSDYNDDYDDEDYNESNK
ncbi:MAG: hypothetical protein ACRCX2_23435 [Paraclostridium sp.]